MANQAGRPIAPARKLVAAVMGTIAVFVMALGLGMASWAVVVFGVALLALSIALGMVNVVRRGARAWVAGSAEVKAISPPPTLVRGLRPRRDPGRGRRARACPPPRSRSATRGSRSTSGRPPATRCRSRWTSTTCAGSASTGTRPSAARPARTRHRPPPGRPAYGDRRRPRRRPARARCPPRRGPTRPDELGDRPTPSAFDDVLSGDDVSSTTPRDGRIVEGELVDHDDDPALRCHPSGRQQFGRRLRRPAPSRSGRIRRIRSPASSDRCRRATRSLPTGGRRSGRPGAWCRVSRSRTGTSGHASRSGSHGRHPLRRTTRTSTTVRLPTQPVPSRRRHGHRDGPARDGHSRFPCKPKRYAPQRPHRSAAARRPTAAPAPARPADRAPGDRFAD